MITVTVASCKRELASAPPGRGGAHVGWRERLVGAVRECGRTQNLIASDAGITPESLSRVLNGSSAKPSLVTIAKIAYAAGTSVGFVLEEEGFDLSAGQLGELEGVIWFLQDAIERVDSAELLRLRRFVDNSTLAVHSVQRSSAEETYLWRSVIRSLRSETFRERLARLRPVLEVFRGARMEIGGSRGTSGMLYLRAYPAKPFYIGGANQPEAGAIVRVVNFVLDLCDPGAADDDN